MNVQYVYYIMFFCLGLILGAFYVFILNKKRKPKPITRHDLISDDALNFGKEYLELIKRVIQLENDLKSKNNLKM